jgi:hypothetical protein
MQFLFAMYCDRPLTIARLSRIAFCFSKDAVFLAPTCRLCSYHSFQCRFLLT